MRNGLALALLVVAGCGSTGNGANNCSLVGSWTAPSPVSATFKSDGTYTATFMGANDTGTWSLNGSSFSTTDAGCGPMPGVYTVTFSADCATATFALVSDTCGRAQTLNHLVFTRQ